MDLRKAVLDAPLTRWFEIYLNKARGLGNTDTLIYACKQRGATLIVHKEDFAEDIHVMHKIKTTSVNAIGFAHRPSRSVVDNNAIIELVHENRRIQALAELLLTIMEQKGID